MSVADYFSEFNKNLLIDSTIEGNISNRYKQITKRLNQDFYGSESETNHSLYVGSYGRSTDIVTSDIDVIFILPSDLYAQYNAWKTNGQSGLLQAVAKSIQKTYSTTYLGADGQVIKLNFTDGINFEIVPVFDLDDDNFKFPDSNDGGSWKTTNPRPEIKAIRDADTKYNGNIRRLARMVRAWKYNCDVQMGGLLIDTLAFNFMKDWNCRDKSYLYYDYLTRDFFKYLSEQNKEQGYWNAVGSNQRIYRKGIFEAKAKKAYNLALEAIDYYNKKYYFTAKSKWREIYGNKFPS
jgi:Second Messenger Oligonucleotide or Dinucleotide Synthetase domain